MKQYKDLIIHGVQVVRHLKVGPQTLVDGLAVLDVVMQIMAG